MPGCNEWSCPMCDGRPAAGERCDLCGTDGTEVREREQRLREAFQEMADLAERARVEAWCKANGYTLRRATKGEDADADAT